MFEKRNSLAVISFLRNGEGNPSQQFFLGIFTNEELAIGNMLDWLASEETKRGMSFEEIKVSDYLKTLGKEKDGIASRPNFYLKRIFKGRSIQEKDNMELTYFLSVVPFETNKQTFIINSGVLF